MWMKHVIIHKINLLVGKLMRMIFFMQGMADISKKEFAELAIDGRNYLTWAMDVKINLAADATELMK
jgi:hypothetical protein